MAQSLSRILLHVVFSTVERRPFLRDPHQRDELHRYLGGILNERGCASILVGGTEDHVHLVFALSRTATVAETIKEVKRSSAVWIKRRPPNQADFAWQAGYGAFSLGYSQLEATRAYVANQEEHHRKRSFQDEFRALLEKYQVAYDEDHVWR